MVDKKRKVWLTKEQVLKIFQIAQPKPLYFVMIVLMRFGLRVGEICGHEGLPGGLPGIYRGDVRENGIWVRGKGYAAGIVQDRLITMPSWVLALVREQLPPRGNMKVFPITARHARRLVKGYAREAGVEDWERISPHRLRAFFATDAKDNGIDAFTIRDLMRHKNISTTNLYVGQSTPNQLVKVIERLGAPEVSG